jgi:phosphatidylserine/phosphatidylglycerophosphate/cardiolipin synthase-like enzyme
MEDKMINIVKTPTYYSFLNLVKNSNDEVILCAPYIKQDIIKKILDSKKQGVKIKVITSSNIANFINGSLDIGAIKQLIKNGCNVLNYQDLHAKIYLFDNDRALITSANLTNNGLFKNYEYGVLIENENEIINQIYADFIAMMDSKFCGIFNLKIVLKIEKIVSEFNERLPVIIDPLGDNIISIQSIQRLTKHLSPWEKDVFECIDSLQKNNFLLSDIYFFSRKLAGKHPLNNNIKPKIRQMLQHLRDLGLIKFIKPGSYKKLW